MLQSQADYRHFSAEVRIELRADNRTFDVWSIGPSELILVQPEDISICDNAELFIWVDGKQFRWPVRLPRGAVPFDAEVYMVPLGPLAPV